MKTLSNVVRNLWFHARFGYDRRAEVVRSRRWWRLAYKLRLAPSRRICERCGRQPGTEKLWSQQARRYVFFCEWCERLFNAVEGNRRARRAFERSTRKRRKA